MPASAQDIPKKEDIPNEKGIDLKLYQCKYCGLVQFDCDPVSYYKKVIRAGGETTTMVNLRRNQYEKFIKEFDLFGKKILEVGCGQGEFLNIWKEYNIHAVGIEYSKDLVEIAKDKGLEVYKNFIDNAETKVQAAPYDAFVQFNFLEHQPFPNQMLQGIFNNLSDDAVGLVTVPSLEYILQHDGYYELIRDHIAYYSIDTLKLLFAKNGFEVLFHETINRDTHSIWVKKRKSINVSSWINSMATLKQEIHSLLNTLSATGGKAAIWGASHQGFTLIPTLDLSSKISYIIDSAYFKQNKFAPASHLPIVAPDYFHNHPVDTIIIIAPGYTDEIAEIIRQNLSTTISIYTVRSNHLERL
jgi:methionine biosynthesis protein metW